MKLLRIGAIGAERPVLLDQGRYLDLSELAPDINAQFWADGCLDRIRAALDNNSLPPIDVVGQRIGAPIARPGAVVCIGMNYEAHAAEAGVKLPEHLVMFYKASNTVVGPNDDLLLPLGSVKTDWEIELGVVIGRRARYLSTPAEALECVAGYCISNDVSERTFQLEISGGQWSKGKSCESFNPLGPLLLTADELNNPQQLRLHTRVNGETRQDSSTGDMAISVASLIWQLSQITVLEPGDLINTGTPQGVALSGRFPYLKVGDTIEMEIENLGRQRQRVRQATARDT
jgi:2-keto-4-pentenoate hydratase/2-oxohepta-3-ene-1,7-dioic acid hydratase in catechol pathway